MVNSNTSMEQFMKVNGDYIPVKKLSMVKVYSKYQEILIQIQVPKSMKEIGKKTKCVDMESISMLTVYRGEWKNNKHHGRG